MTRKILNHSDWIIAVFLSLAAVWLHFIFLTHAGALWRDEVAITNISRLPTLGQVWRALPHDQCPIVFPMLVRFWSRFGFGATDAGLRILGLGLGLVLLASFWIASRMMGKGLPLLCVAFAGLNFTVIRYGDSLRAYGLAAACIVLTTALIWRFVEVPSPRRGFLAGVAAVISVQVLYQNAFLLLAVCIAGAVVCFRRGRHRNALTVLSIGAVAAISLLPYVVPIYRAQSWWIISRTGVDWTMVFNRISAATGSLLVFWLVLPLVAAVLGVRYVLTNVLRKETDIRQDLPLFASVALVIGLITFGIFIKLAELPTETWYYITAMGFTAVCCDAILSRIHRQVHIGVMAVAVIAGLLAFPAAFVNLKLRQTNGDSVAALITQKAGPKDLIVVYPWYYGVTFAHDYHGATPWTTLPPLADYRFFRYDFVKVDMQRTNAIEPILEKAKSTLSSGHYVWLVGPFPKPQPDAPPLVLPPAPHSPVGWDETAYTFAWGTQFSYFILHHVINGKVMVMPNKFINPMEDMTVIRTSGWRPRTQTNLP